MSLSIFSLPLSSWFNSTNESLRPPPVDLSQFQRLHTQSEHRTLAEIPPERSGHRCFYGSDDVFYVVGGYSANVSVRGVESVIYREVWALNLLSKKWKRMTISGSFPTALASFSLAQREPYSDIFMVFGGSGATFGASNSNKMFEVVVDDEKSMAIGKERVAMSDNVKAPSYGHAMISGPSPGIYFIVGGTNGFEYNLDIHVFKTIRHLGIEAVIWDYLTTQQDGGAYRMEIILDDNRLFVFGGGTSRDVLGFDIMFFYNLDTGGFEVIKPIGDENDDYPVARRCHSATQWGREVVIAGGCTPRGAGLGEIIVLEDVWFFHLDTFRWRRHHYNLVDPVFFHSAAVSTEGCLTIFGGTLDESSKHRSNTTQICWLAPPSLKTFATWSLKKHFPSVFEDDGADLRLRDSTKIIKRFFGYSSDAEKNCETPSFEEEPLLSEVDFAFA
ncbi:unnamed protein product [Caenorhabditis auriculariae]|uniref:Uncharacterized protein n=1 Tax=Caenorhabditis auriculariae TaxID=2777116 RepID=A0A8S1HPU8_9PELO|nr:unnamed protein product [Caenorhabditis auriculariae]